MFSAATRLGASHRALMDLLRTRPDLRDGPGLDRCLDLLARRRSLDLSDLSSAEQCGLIASRSAELLPGAGRLDSLLAAGRPLVVKFGIDPTAEDVHIGHAVPMIVASRFQRMGHRVVFIVGDVTGRIGDPSGRTADRPALTDADIRHNVATYREQVTPFFDFDRARFHFNSEWLSRVSLPAFLSVLERLPLSAALQRDDFRRRLAAHSGLTMAELTYAVVMALDSVQIGADVEIGGHDQLLNLRMCRRVMENAGQPPEVVVTTALLEGTDGTGAKMSKSRGNYVGLRFAPADVFGRLMALADRMLPDYLRDLTELLDPEIDLLEQLHPMDVKTLLASDVTATVHGRDAAAASRDGFVAQFSRRRLSDRAGIPAVDAQAVRLSTVAELFAGVTGLVSSRNQVRRVAVGNGLRRIDETPDGRSSSVPIADADITVEALGSADAGARTFLRCGRAVLELERMPSEAA